MNVLAPEKAVISEDMELSEYNQCPPKVVFNDRIIILIDKDNKLIFYDIMRRKIVARCELKVKSFSGYQVVGDEIIISSNGDTGYKKICLPFLPEAKNGDFVFYTAIDTILPNPFTSFKDLAPNNILEPLNEYACLPSYWSSSHQAVALQDEKWISEVFEKQMPFFNDEFG